MKFEKTFSNLKKVKEVEIKRKEKKREKKDMKSPTRLDYE